MTLEKGYGTYIVGDNKQPVTIKFTTYFVPKIAKSGLVSNCNVLCALSPSFEDTGVMLCHDCIL